MRTNPLALFLLVAVAGGVSTPVTNHSTEAAGRDGPPSLEDRVATRVPSRQSQGTPARRLQSHVEFLARPKLKGRAPGSLGSRRARKYIEELFKSCGLAPWNSAKSYEQSFGYGINLVGILPGSDRVLARELVLVSAHYDHLGRVKGKTYPGAADNASGVAALLEAARVLSSSTIRPKRSILFVTFDCEEMMCFGSFAFSCQKEVQQAPIVAVVNSDMLGRDFFDVIQRTVFVTGTERYPELRDLIQREAVRAGMRVLPFGTDLVGPRSDHVAFEARGIPCLFFSCGTFKDYHEPEDTAEKLNYDELAASTSVVIETVKVLADRTEIDRPVSPASGYIDELKGVDSLLSEIKVDPARAGVKKEDLQDFIRLADEAHALSTNANYNGSMRRELIVEASGILAPYFLPTDFAGRNGTAAERRKSKVLLQYLHEFYLAYGPQIIDGYRQLVGQVLKYRPGLLRGMPKFDYEFYNLADDDISLKQCGQDSYMLNALASSWNMTAQVKRSKGLLKTFSYYLGSTLEPMDCQGTREQLADFCLLRLRTEQTNSQHAAGVMKILERVTGTTDRVSYQELLAKRLDRGGFKDETEWIVACMLQPPPNLVLQAIDAARGSRDAQFGDAACRVLTNSSVRPEIRAAAMPLACRAAPSSAARALCNILEDPTPVYDRVLVAMSAKDYPFANRHMVKAALTILDQQSKTTPAKSLGELARTRLKNLVHRDLGKEPQRWRNWLNSHPLPD